MGRCKIKRRSGIGRSQTRQGTVGTLHDVLFAASHSFALQFSKYCFGNRAAFSSVAVATTFVISFVMFFITGVVVVVGRAISRTSSTSGPSIVAVAVATVAVHHIGSIGGGRR